MLETLAIKLCVLLHKSGPKVMGHEIAGIAEAHAIGASVAALGSAWIPGVGGSAATVACAGFIWSMYYRINAKIGLPFAKNIVKSVATGVCTNIAAAAVSSIVVTSLLSFVPGIGTLASELIMACLCFSLTWTSALIYLKILIRFAEAKTDMSSIDEAALRAAADDVIAESDLKDLMKKAKGEFKAAKAEGRIKKGKASVEPMAD